MLWYYIKVKKVTFGNLLAVLDVDKDARSGIPTQVLLSGVEGLEYSNNLGADATTAEGHVIPHGIHVKGKLINLMGLGNANVDVTVAKTHLEGMFSLDCMKLGSVIEVVGDSSQLGKTSDASCQGAGVKGYFAILSEAKGGKKSTGNWCKSDACLEGSAAVQMDIPILKGVSTFKIKAEKTGSVFKGHLSGKRIPMGFLPFNMDVDMEWDIPTKIEANAKSLQQSGSAKLALVIDTSQIQSAVAVPMYGAVKVVSAVVKGLKAALRWIIKWIKRALVALRHTITIVIRVVQGAVNVARSFLAQVRKKRMLISCDAGAGWVGLVW